MDILNVKRILAALLFIPVLLHGQPYYIGPNGDDGTGDGSIDDPWFSIGYADASCSAGDTVFARGGTYYYSSTQTINVSGTVGNEIVFINYPDESPIFDFWNGPIGGPGQSINGIYASGRSYLKFEGITIRRLWNIYVDPPTGRAHSHYLDECHHITYTKCVVDSSAGRGWIAYKSADIFHYYCDAIWCADPKASDAGNAGTGFLATGTDGTPSMEDTMLYYQCRGWMCADQAFGNTGDHFTIYDQCWAFSCGLQGYGYTGGTGNGFKPGYTYADIDSIQTLMKNCIGVYNSAYGLNENTMSTMRRTNIRIYNNLFYKNGYDGIISYPSNINTDNIKRYRNNISYDNDRFDHYNEDRVDHSYNSWDSPYTTENHWEYIVSPASVSDADFVVLPADSAANHALLSGARQSDGSLPDLGNYFKLAEGSDLIDIGTPVNGYEGQIPYNGSAPDLGAFEYDGQPDGNISPTVAISSPSSEAEFLAPATINITANASDADGSISKVEFFNGTIKLGERTSGPWSYTWNNVPEGEYAMTAVATDNIGTTTTSVSTYVIVRSENLNIYSDFIIYPNPNNGIFTILTQSPQTINNRLLTIASIDGRVLHYGIILKDELIKKLNLTYIDPGIYIVKITGNNMIQTSRFIKY